MIERTNRTIKEFLSKNIGQYQHDVTKFLPLAMMAYRSSIQSVTKNNPTYVVLGFPLLLPIDFFYSTPKTAIYATPSDSVFTMKQKLQETHQLMQNIWMSKKNARRPIILTAGMDRAKKLAKKCKFSTQRLK